MTYDQHDEARDEMYYQIGRELYPDHKAQAIEEFTAERLRSFYIANSTVMRPAVDSLQQGRKLQESGHHAAAVVFFVTAIELLLKATLLKPVVHGLVHNEGLANVIVQQSLGQAGFDRYTGLLEKLFAELLAMDIRKISRKDISDPLLSECTAQQSLRNKIIHQGTSCGAKESELARLVSVAVYECIVHPMLAQLGLSVMEHGEIVHSGA